IRNSCRKRRLSAYISQSSSQDASTQTESNKITSKFARTFSIISGGLGTSCSTQHEVKQLEVNDEVQELIDCCRRYQISQSKRLHGSVKNLLLVEKEEQNENIGCLIADSMQTVLNTVSKQVLPVGSSLTHTQISNEDSKFEQLLKSRGMEPLHLTNATPL
ncbi:hypothetical protein WUBG_09544, partial [Wuchereria bancrofti]